MKQVPSKQDQEVWDCRSVIEHLLCETLGSIPSSALNQSINLKKRPIMLKTQREVNYIWNEESQWK